MDGRRSAHEHVLHRYEPILLARVLLRIGSDGKGGIEQT